VGSSNYSAKKGISLPYYVPFFCQAQEASSLWQHVGCQSEDVFSVLVDYVSIVVMIRKFYSAFGRISSITIDFSKVFSKYHELHISLSDDSPGSERPVEH
jgi:hypothetical protein